MKRISFILVLVALAAIFSGCDMQTIRKLELEEQEKVKTRVAEFFDSNVTITEFIVTGEGFQDNKTKYLIDYKVKFSQQIPLFAEGLPWQLVFSKQKGKWSCTERGGLLEDVLNGLNPAGKLDEGPWGFGDLLDVINDLDQAGLMQTELTDEEENELGAQLQEQILADSGTSRTDRFNIDKIFRKIVAEANRQKLAWECTVTAEEDFNAYAVAGGKTFLNIGLLSNLDKENEVAFVIAHEVAHNDLKHCVQKVQHGYRAGQVDPLLGELVTVAYGVFKSPFSKDLEYAADKKGVELMTAAGYSKDGAISFFRKLQKHDPAIEDPTLRAVNDFISSHPTAEDRIRRIEQM